MGSLLAIATHPDDESYSFGATIAAATRAGWHCKVLCISDGERGRRYVGGPPGAPTLGAARRGELEASCRLLGVAGLDFVGMPDGQVSDGPFLRRTLAAAGAGADVVLAPGPDGAYGHPDHVATHRASAAIWGDRSADRTRLLFSVFPPGLFAPQWHRCRAMLGNPPQPSLASLGTRAVHYELRGLSMTAVKRAAISAHRSQLPGADPERLFPPGTVRALIAVERFLDSGRRPDPVVRAWFDEWQEAAANSSGG